MIRFWRFRLFHHHQKFPRRWNWNIIGREVMRLSSPVPPGTNQVGRKPESLNFSKRVWLLNTNFKNVIKAFRKSKFPFFHILKFPFLKQDIIFFEIIFLSICLTGSFTNNILSPLTNFYGVEYAKFTDLCFEPDSVLRL